MLPFSVPVDRRLDFLGVLYSSPDPNDDPTGAREVNEAFLEDFRSRVWLTYRKEFASLLNADGSTAGIFSDAGWGCSVRVTQMLTVQCLLSLNFPREWRRSKASSTEADLFARIVALFMDTVASPLSIHSIVRTGHSIFGKRPSEWFGPTTGARAVCHIFNAMSIEDRMHSGLVCFDSGELIRSDVTSQLETAANGVMIFLTHRLGLECFNESRYKSTIQKLFSCPLFQGLSSGEAMVSAYFMYACCDDFLYYLDPHTVQPAFTSVSEISRFLPPQPRSLKMRWNRLNPSMNMGFTIRNKQDLDSLCEFLKKCDPELFEVREHPRPPPKEYDFPDVENDISEDDDIVLIN